MTVRNDLTVDWEASPRIITVASPSTEVTIQDLVDTLRTLEAGFNAMDDPFIIAAAGKEELGGGVLVGITATLQNALLAFEARPGPTFVQCLISGGNLVAIDEFGVTQTTPVQTTAFTQVVLANSSSATLSEQAAIQFSSFDGAVHIDAIAGTPGTNFPAGTPLQPVKDMVDALAIASTRGFEKLHVIGDITFTSGDNIENLTIEGDSLSKSTVTIEAEASTINAIFTDATVTGTLDGDATLQFCDITALNFINGTINQCLIDGPITLGGTADLRILDSWSNVAGGASTAVIDCNDSGNKILIRNYSGGIELRNASSNVVSIDMNSGQVILASTIDSGAWTIRGIAKLTNNATATATVNDLDLMNPTNIANRTWDIEISTVASVGTTGAQLKDKVLTVPKFLGLK